MVFATKTIVVADDKLPCTPACTVNGSLGEPAECLVDARTAILYKLWMHRLRGTILIHFKSGASSLVRPKVPKPWWPSFTGKALWHAWNISDKFRRKYFKKTCPHIYCDDAEGGATMADVGCRCWV